MSDVFIGFSDETSPDEIAQDAFDYIEAQIPGWVPAAGNLETILLEALAQEAAIERGIAGETATDVFRYFGQLVGIIPNDGAQATGTSTWTAIDDTGYTIPSGTQFTVDSAGGETLPFETVGDYLINPGSTSSTVGGVAIRAIDLGEVGNGLSGDGSLVDALAFVESITVVPSTSGGEDPEEDDAYLDRLSEQLRLQAPRPILPRDFEVLAKSVDGVERATAIDGYVPGTNEEQALTNDAAGGSFTLTFETQTTGNIDWDATAVEVQTALEALSNVDPGDVIVTGGPLPTLVTVEFAGLLGRSNRTTMTADDTLLTGETLGTTITTPVPGVAPLTSEERTITLAVIDEDGANVSPTVKTAVEDDLEARREINFVVYVIDPERRTIDVDFTIVSYEQYDATDVVARAIAAVEEYLAPANWGIPNTAQSGTDWINEDTVRYLEVAETINRVDGVWYIDTLTVEGGTTDVDLSGYGPVVLTEAGTVTGASA